jgi:hypothetical protein
MTAFGRLPARFSFLKEGYGSIDRMGNEEPVMLVRLPR